MLLVLSLRAWRATSLGVLFEISIVCLVFVLFCLSGFLLGVFWARLFGCVWGVLGLFCLSGWCWFLGGLCVPLGSWCLLGDWFFWRV